jgi:hypothetical protein
MNSFSSIPIFDISGKHFNTQVILSLIDLDKIIILFHKEILNGLVDSIDDDKIILYLTLESDNQIILKQLLKDQYNFA